MYEMLGTARNIILVPYEEDRIRASIEAIIVVSESRFIADEAGQMVSTRQAQSLRFSTSVDGLRLMSKHFSQWADEAEAQERKFNPVKPEKE